MDLDAALLLESEHGVRHAWFVGIGASGRHWPDYKIHNICIL
jgi:hypothetical protein